MEEREMTEGLPPAVSARVYATTRKRREKRERRGGQMAARVAIDIGGTFTVLVLESGQGSVIAKALLAPDDSDLKK